MPACYAAACRGGDVALAVEPVTISLLGYTKNMRCTWVIIGVPPIELEFISFNTEPFLDLVTVYRGNGTDVLLKEFSGKNRPARLKVRASTLTVTFTSRTDGTQYMAGFVARLNATGGCAPTSASVPPLDVSPLVGASVCPHRTCPLPWMLACCVNRAPTPCPGARGT
jgi:hypothetical protein